MASTESDSAVGEPTTRRRHSLGLISGARRDQWATGLAPSVSVALDGIEPPQSGRVQDPPELAVSDTGPDHRSRVGRGVTLAALPQACGQQRAFLGADALRPQPTVDIADVQVPGQVGLGLCGGCLGGGAGAFPVL